MSQRAWLWCLAVAWLLLSVGLGLAASRGFLESGQSAIKIIVAIFAAGAIPLSWLGLAGRFEELAKTTVLQALGRYREEPKPEHAADAP